MEKKMESTILGLDIGILSGKENGTYCLCLRLSRFALTLWSWKFVRLAASHDVSHILNS